MVLKQLAILFFIFYFNIGYSQTWDQLETEYNNLTKNEQKDAALRKAKEIYFWVKVNESDTSIHLPISLKFIGNAFMNINKDSALHYYDSGLKVLNKQSRENNIQAARIHYNISNIYYKLKLIDKSLESALKSNSILNVIGYSEYPFCIWPLKSIVEIYSSQKDFKSALPYELQSFKIIKRILGENNETCANSLANIGLLNYNSGDLKSAEEYLIQSLIIFKKINYPKYDYPAKVIYSIILYYNSIKAPKDKYESHWIELIYLFKKFNKVNTEECGDFLQSLGSYYFTKQRNKEAEIYIKESIESYKNSIGEDNLLCSGNYYWLGAIYDRKEDYISAEKYYLKSLDIYKRILPTLDKKEKEIYSPEEGIAMFYWGLGLYDKSINLYSQLKSTCIDNKDTTRLISLIVPMSIAYIDNKNFVLANKFLLNQLKYFPNISKDNINVYLLILGSISLSYSALDSITEMEFYLNKELELSKKYFGELSKEYLHAVNNRCSYLTDRIETKKANKIIDYGLDLSKKIHRDDTKGYTDNLANYAGYYKHIGNYKKSIGLYQIYFQNFKLLKLSFDKIYNYNLEDYLSALYFNDDYSLAFDILSELYQRKKSYLIENAFYLNENERERVWDKERGYFDWAVEFASVGYFKNILSSSELAYNSSLVSKGLLMSSSIDAAKTINDSNDSTMINLYYKLKSIRISISKISSETNEYQDLITQLTQQSDSLDQLLSRKMSSYADYKKDFAVEWKNVQTNLSNNEVSIEFARYFNDSDSTYNYLALIIKQGDKHPQLVKLCSEYELKQNSPETELSVLYDLVWKPLLPSLTNIKTIYYSPSGLLNNIPFQALYKEENGQREYVMDKFILHQLTSTRYLALGLKKKAQEPIQTSIALFGGINYNEYPNYKIDTTNHDQSNEASFLLKNAIVQNRNLDSTRTGAKYLPGTKKEVETIANVLNAKQWNIDISEGKNATENKMKSFSGNNSKAILHIATHGFAFPDKEEKRKDMAFAMMNGNDKYKALDNPMIRSGLLFGGANLTWQGKGDSLLNTTNEDGVLTAYELSQLDLSKTKLAVLSACETGKGAIQGSEGTFGLKRALKLAGVDNMIVSLWKVPDDATMELMTLFYTELANTKKPVSSFETAQKTMRLNHPNKPEKWAGFVFVR